MASHLPRATGPCWDRVLEGVVLPAIEDLAGSRLGTLDVFTVLIYSNKAFLNFLKYYLKSNLPGDGCGPP